MTPNRALALYGSTEAAPEMVPLAVGPLSFTLDRGALRWVKLGDVEVLRQVSFTIRDRIWGTVVPTLRDVAIEKGAAGLRVRFVAESRLDEGVLTWHADIRGEPDGNLRFSVSATPDRDVSTNRTGFVVLHPLEGVAGRPVEVEQVDGSRVQAAFPALIAPDQPISHIRALKHEVVPGVFATCRMDGETWEMEDHRNWTDANFKTYSRLLSSPWPYTIRAGERVEQAVSLTFDGPAAKVEPAVRTATIAVDVGEAVTGVMPRIGIGVPSEYAAAALGASDLLRFLAPQFLICEYIPAAGDRPDVLVRYRDLAAALGTEAVLHAVLPNQAEPRAELAALAQDVGRAGLQPAALVPTPAPHLMSILPGTTPPAMPPLTEIYAAARAAFPGVVLGGGMHSFFTELNRTRPPAALLDYVTHATCNVIHAADDRSVMETLAALPHIVRTTCSFIGDKPYRVGPSKIGMRHNPYGASFAPNPDNIRLTMVKMDPRQRGCFAAAWAVGYVAELAQGGVEAIALCEPVGELGLIYRRGAYAQPWFDGEPRAQVYPVFHAVRWLAHAAGLGRLRVSVSAPGAVTALACRRPSAMTLWIANLSDETREIRTSGIRGERAFVHLLDETTFVHATTDVRDFADAAAGAPDVGRLVLRPYAVVRIDAIW
ncbi:MAG: hypothetical protein FJX56_02805 [Alphaproteobacteria bacterium]|nr:hypothetical protein [Alphaproteobacteria bacterium]